jgi:hypothetical protein
MLGGISHHAIARSSPATNVVEETARLRNAIDLPRSVIVLAEPPESLIVMDTAASKGSPAVMWIDANDATRLGSLQSLHQPQVWTSYAGFFEFLLGREEEERA